MTLIKDLIKIPEVVHRGDFVLKLTEGITRPEETVKDYVVTEQLAKCFDDALRSVAVAFGICAPGSLAAHSGGTTHAVQVEAGQEPPARGFATQRDRLLQYGVRSQRSVAHLFRRLGDPGR